MRTISLLLSSLALSASAQVVVRPVSGVPTLGSSAAAWNSGAAVSFSAIPAKLPSATIAVTPLFTPVSAVAPLPIDARAALVKAAPVMTNLPASASGESQSVGGRIVFDAAATRAENTTPVIASAAGEAPLPLKPAVKSAVFSPAPAAAFAAIATTASSEGMLIPMLVMGVLAIGIFLLLRWSKNNLRKITEQEIAEFRKTIEARKAEWLSIPGVKSLEIVPLNRMDDTPPAYLKITVGHIGPDNKDLLPQHHEKWSPVIASMFPASLREAARIASLDGKGYWPIAVTIAR